MTKVALQLLAHASRRGGDALRRVLRGARRRIAVPPPGGFQPYNFTAPNRFPWLFEFARRELDGIARPHLLSFGCSWGDEVMTLREYFPAAVIKGIDIDPRNIARCLSRRPPGASIDFAAAAGTDAEPSRHYDAIFCLGVLCHGDLTTYGAIRSDPILKFAAFERTVADFARCLKAGGLLVLHTTNFRFCDTAVCDDFAVVLEAAPHQLTADVLFDTDNRLMPGVRYRAVAFRKRPAPGCTP